MVGFVGSSAAQRVEATSFVLVEYGIKKLAWTMSTYLCMTYTVCKLCIRSVIPVYVGTNVKNSL